MAKKKVKLNKKKFVRFLILCVIVIGLLVFGICKLIQLLKTPKVVDETAPVINLVGDENIILIKGSKYEEYGATAIDDIDGDITANIEIDTSELDINTAGTYYVKYLVSDAAGNPSRVRRKVTVYENGPESMNMVEFTLHPFYDDVICKETEYDEEKYEQLILFGDSFIEKLGEIGIVPYSQLWSRPSLSTDDFYERPIYTYCYLDDETTFFKAMDRDNPSHVLILLNSDWIGRWSVEYFAESCDKAYGKIKDEYPNTEFIICSIMPSDLFLDDEEYISIHGIAKDDKINKMNVELCKICRKYGFKFMNAAEALKNPETGSCYEGYIETYDYVHLTYEACQIMVDYIKTHLDW